MSIRSWKSLFRKSSSQPKTSNKRRGPQLFVEQLEELTLDATEAITDAAARITVQGARLPEAVMKLTDR